MWVEIDVESDSGTHYRRACSKPIGFRSTAINPVEHMKKIRDTFPRVFDAAQIEQCVSTLRRLEEASSNDMTEFIDLLRGLEQPYP